MTGVSRLLVLTMLPWLFWAPACGPVTYVSRVTFGALGEVDEARVRNAEKMAPYEYTGAVEYLRRSQELAGYARFHDANNFAKKSRQMAAAAKQVTERRTKNNELPIYDPNDKNQYITKDGIAKRKGSLEQDVDTEKPPGLDNEKPPLGPIDDASQGKAGKRPKGEAK